jgi:hypothetical protein
MLSRCRGSIGTEKLSNSFKNVNSSIELLQKIGDQNKLMGILMCFKYFKSIINKYFKVSPKNKKLDSLIDLNKLNEKLDTLSSKLEFLEKNFLNNTNNNTKTNASGNTSCITDNISHTNSNHAVHNESQFNTYLDL